MPNAEGSGETWSTDGFFTKISIIAFPRHRKKSIYVVSINWVD